MVQQTPIEWLEEGLNTVLTHEQHMQVIGLFLQAKQMFQKQVEIAYEKGQDDKSNVYFGNEYYNETYNTRLLNETYGNNQTK
jgi:hypothetical protein